MMWSNDPVRDADNYYAEQDEWLSRRPVCCMCREHIQEDRALHLVSHREGLNHWVCDICVSNFRANVEVEK